MKIALATHQSSFDHVAPYQHPERPERLVAAVEGVRMRGIEVLEVEARAATRRELAAAHDPVFLEQLQHLSGDGGGSVDSDTYVVGGSWNAARFAAGAGLSAIEAIERGGADAGFVAVRPPGHHAERARAMGFCLINNVAVSAAALVGRGERVAVVDWDVHHGNGTQEIFFDSPDVLYLSIHRAPFYPGTGRIEEVGRGLGTGATVNIPIPAGSNGLVYEQAFSRVVLPILEQFDPDWVLVSAGYDAHGADPLGGMRLGEDDYRAMAARLGASMRRTRTAFFLEGGYDLNAVRGSVSATVTGFSDPPPILNPPMSSDPSIDRAVEVLSLFWDLD